METEIPDDLKPLLFDGKLFYGKWGEIFFVSKNRLSYTDLAGTAGVTTVKDSIYGRYFLQDIEPAWQRDSIMRDLYRYAKPWATDLSGLDSQQLMAELLKLFQRDELRVWRLTDGWAVPPEPVGGNQYTPAGSTAVAGASAGPAPATTGKASKPKGGGSSAAQPVAAKAAVHEVEPVSSSAASAGPQSLSECQQLLAASRDKLGTTGTYNPKYTSDELSAMAAKGVVAKERFIVSLQKVKTAPDAPVGYARPSLRTTAWTTTFDLAENSDTDPELLCDLNGMTYDPNADYELVLIDQGLYYQKDGAVNFIPTYDRLGELGKTEFAGEFLPHEIDEVLTPEYSAHYKEVMDEYSAVGGKPWEETKLDMFLEERYAADEAAARKFKVRNSFNTEIGANEHFSGDGVTKTTGSSAYGLEPGKNGNLEMLLFEHSPQSVADLEGKGAIIRIPAKPIFGKGKT